MIQFQRTCKKYFVCLGKECLQYPLSPNNGYMICTDNKFLHSDCRFTCDVGYRLIGSDGVQCVEEEENMNWNGETPTCISRF